MLAARAAEPCPTQTFSLITQLLSRWIKSKPHRVRRTEARQLHYCFSLRATTRRARAPRLLSLPGAPAASPRPLKSAPFLDADLRGLFQQQTRDSKRSASVGELLTQFFDPTGRTAKE